MRTDIFQNIAAPILSHRTVIDHDNGHFQNSAAPIPGLNTVIKHDNTIFQNIGAQILGANTVIDHDTNLSNPKNTTVTDNTTPSPFQTMLVALL